MVFTYQESFNGARHRGRTGVIGTGPPGVLPGVCARGAAEGVLLARCRPQLLRDGLFGYSAWLARLDLLSSSGRHDPLAGSGVSLAGSPPQPGPRLMSGPLLSRSNRDGP